MPLEEVCRENVFDGVLVFENSVKISYGRSGSKQGVAVGRATEFRRILVSENPVSGDAITSAGRVKRRGPSLLPNPVRISDSF